MLAHVLAILGLALYGFEVYRTVDRFGVRRPGTPGRVDGGRGRSREGRASSRRGR